MNLQWGDVQPLTKIYQPASTEEVRVAEVNEVASAKSLGKERA